VHRTAILTIILRISGLQILHSVMWHSLLKKIMLFVKCVNVSTFIPVGKLQLSMHRFSRNSQIYAAFFAYLL